MAYLKEQFDNKSLHLDDLCNLLTEEISELATAEYKLKLVFVLVHIIEESQKALGKIDIDNCLKELQELVEKACEKSEKQEKALNDRFTRDKVYFDKVYMDVIEERNDELQNLHDEIISKLEQFNKFVKQLARERDKKKPEEVVRQSKH